MKGQDEIRDLVKKNHSLIMNRAKMEAKVLMHKTRKDLALYDELHYKNPETAGCLEVLSHGSQKFFLIGY